MGGRKGRLPDTHQEAEAMTHAARLSYPQLAPKAFQGLLNLSGALRRDPGVRSYQVVGGAAGAIGDRSQGYVSGIRRGAGQSSMGSRGRRPARLDDA